MWNAFLQHNGSLCSDGCLSGRVDPQETLAGARILARLLQKGVFLEQISSSWVGNEHIDFWLYVMMSVLDWKIPLAEDPASPSQKKIRHARDIETYGRGMTRDPSHIRRLLQLSRDHKFEPMLMRGCLVSILCILIMHRPNNEPKRRLVNHYLEIVAEEMDTAAWSFSLAGVLNAQRSEHFSETSMRVMVLSLLSGECLATLNDRQFDQEAQTIMRMYDFKLSAAGAQPTTSILEVMANAIWNTSWIAGLQLQNAWLSLYVHNRSRSPHNSTIPVVWPPDCTSIALKRLDLYDNGYVTPETDIIIFFLSSPSTSVTCRALRWYFHLEEDTLPSNGIQYFTSFPTIFRRGLSADENRDSWLVLVEALFPNWSNMSLEGKSHFVGAFFGYESPREDFQAAVDHRAMLTGVANEEDVVDQLDMGTVMGHTKVDGLGWMEDVWKTVLAPLVRDVRVDRLIGCWPELSGVMHAIYPDLADSTKSNPPINDGPSSAHSMESDGTHDGGIAMSPMEIEERLEVSARGLLGLLAQLLAVGTNVMPAPLLHRLRSSCLLSEECVHHDLESLRHIQTMLGSNREE